MTLRNLLLLSAFVVVTLLFPRIASPQELTTAKQVAQTTSLKKLSRVLKQKVLVVKALTKQRYWAFEKVSHEMDFVETVTDRIRYLTNAQGEESKPVAQALFDKVVTIFDMIHETAAREMESLQIKAMDSESAMESLLASERWKELEITASMANYRLNKAKYYWALVCPDSAPNKEKLLKEAVDGFLTSHSVVYQNAELTAYSFLIRALCLRELGDLEASEKELDYIIHHGEKAVSPELISRARYEQANNFVRAGKYRDCLEEANTLLANVQAFRDDPDLRYGIKLLKINSSFMLLADKEGRLDSKQVGTIYGEALVTVNQLIRANSYWQEKVFSTLTQEPVWKYLQQQKSHDPYIGWVVGEGLFYERKFSAAIPLFKRALDNIDSDVFPGKGDLNFKLGVSYYNQRQFKHAIPCLGRCVNKYSRAATAEEASYLLFKAYEQVYGDNWNQSYVKAITYFLKQYPKHHGVSDAHYRLGKYYGQRKKRRSAIAELARVGSESKHYVAAKFYIFKYRTEEFERLRSAGANSKKAYTYAVRGKNDFLAAMRNSRQAQPSAKEGVSGRMMSQYELLSARLFIYGPEAKYQQGIQEIRNFEARYPREKELFLSVGIARIEAYQKLGQFEKAEAEVRKVIQKAAKHSQGKEVLLALAGHLARDAEPADKPAAKDYRIALLLYEHILSKSRQTPLEEEIQYALASLYLKAGDYGQAKTIYREIVKNDPRSAEALSGLGEICEREMAYEEALEYWRLLEEQLTVGDSAWYEAKYKLALTHDFLGNPQRACKILTVTRKLHPDLGGEANKKRFLELEMKVCSP